MMGSNSKSVGANAIGGERGAIPFSLSAKPFNSASKQTTCKSTKLLEYLFFFLLTMPLAYERRENKKEHMSRMRLNTAILMCHLVSVLRQKTSLRS